jgi:hypothetical protein
VQEQLILSLVFLQYHMSTTNHLEVLCPIEFKDERQDSKQQTL